MGKPQSNFQYRRMVAVPLIADNLEIEPITIYHLKSIKCNKLVINLTYHTPDKGCRRWLLLQPFSFTHFQTFRKHPLFFLKPLLFPSNRYKIPKIPPFFQLFVKWAQLPIT